MIMLFRGIKNIDELLKIAASIWSQLKQKYSDEDILFSMKNDPSYDRDKLQNVTNLPEALNTVNGKLGKFVRFILIHIEEIKSNYQNSIANIINEYLVAVNSTKIKFDTPIEHFESVQQLKETLDKMASEINPIKNQKDFERVIKNVNPEGTEKFEIGDEFLVIHPQTAEESAYWGTGTTWCTASRTLTGNYFNYYTEEGDKFYIIIDKTNNEKYGYATKTGELQDKTNNPMLKNLFTLDLLNRENGEEVLQQLYELTNKKEFLERDEETLYLNSVNEANENNERNIEWYDKIPNQALEQLIETANGDTDLIFEEINKFRDISKQNIEYTNEMILTKVPERYKEDYNYTDVETLPIKPRTYEENKKYIQNKFNSLIRKMIFNKTEYYYQIDSLHLFELSDVILEFPDIPVEGLSVGGDLDLSFSRIQSLPEGLSVGGDLYLSNSQIQSLPEGLSVGGSLYLSYSQIQSLPEGLNVGGTLRLGNTQIQSLPEGLSVGGDLYLRGTPIQSLPEGLSVGGSLYLHGTPIQSLPEGLTVGGSLYLHGTPIQSLPENLSVVGDLYYDSKVFNTVKELREHLREKFPIIKKEEEFTSKKEVPNFEFKDVENLDQLIEKEEKNI